MTESVPTTPPVTEPDMLSATATDNVFTSDTDKIFDGVSGFMVPDSSLNSLPAQADVPLVWTDGFDQAVSLRQQSPSPIGTKDHTFAGTLLESLTVLDIARTIISAAEGSEHVGKQLVTHL